MLLKIKAEEAVGGFYSSILVCNKATENPSIMAMDHTGLAKTTSRISLARIGGWETAFILDFRPNAFLQAEAIHKGAGRVTREVLETTQKEQTAAIRR